MSGERWWHQAACTGTDPKMWSPRSAHGRATVEALRLCDGCPVRGECRDDMLEVRPKGPAAIIAGGWRWDNLGAPVPHPDDLDRAMDLIAAAAARVGDRGAAWPYHPFQRQAHQSRRHFARSAA